MNDALPLVTVVTPSYNHGRFLDQCLESISGQTYPLVEHLVMDACSTDNTPEVIKSFLPRHDLTTVVEPDAGQADALNKGFARARGEIFCWLNADDYWLHERVIEDAVRFICDGADIVTGGGCVVDSEGGRLFRIRPDRQLVVPEIRYHDTLLQPATFWRRQVHRPLRPDVHFAFDWRLFIEMIQSGARVEVVDSEWAAHRKHRDSKTERDPSLRRAEIADILLEQWGRRSPQHVWARSVYFGFRLAEATHLNFLKRGILLVNLALARLTSRRVYSC